MVRVTRPGGSGGDGGGSIPQPEELLSVDNTDIFHFHPLAGAVAEGTFVAPSNGKVKVQIDVEGTNYGNAWNTLSLVLGKPVNGKVHKVAHYLPPVDGALLEQVGRANADGLYSAHRVIDVDGLDPGASYMASLESTVIGSYEQIVGIAFPSDIAFYDASVEDPSIGSLKMGMISQLNQDSQSTKLYPIKLAGRPYWSILGPDVQGARHNPIVQQNAITVTEVTTGISMVAAIPSGTKVVGVAPYHNSFTGTVVVVNTEPKTYALVNPPGAATSPGCVCAVSDTEVWVGFANGYYCALNPQTNTWGTPQYVGGNVAVSQIVTDGDVLWIATNNGYLFRRILSSGAMTNTAFLGTGICRGLALAPDRVFYAQGNTNIRMINTDTLAIETWVITDRGPISSIACVENGEVLHVTTESGYWDYYATDLNQTLPRGRYDGLDMGGWMVRVRLTKDEYIYVCGDNVVHHWPGGIFDVKSVGGMAGHCRMKVFSA